MLGDMHPLTQAVIGEQFQRDEVFVLEMPIAAHAMKASKTLPAA